MPSHHRLLSLCTLVTCLAFAAPGIAQGHLWFLSAGGGVTNRWFAHDVDEPIDARELRAGWGRSVSQRLAWLVTLDHGSYWLPSHSRSTSLGLTPQLRYTRGRLVADGGLGLMRNDIESDGYTYRYKWTPQASVGVRLWRDVSREVTLSYSLVHYSHSQLSNRRNLAINLNLFRLSLLWRR